MPKYYIKLNGENIIGHIDEVDQGGYNPSDYDQLIEISRLTNDSGQYIYKYSGGGLVTLTQNEIDNHPNVTENQNESKFDKVREKILTRVALQEVINHPSVPQALKNRAQAKLTKVNQELAAILGV